MDVQVNLVGGGGDLALNGNDMAIVTGVENMPLLACFGGASFWGNELLFVEPDLFFNSETEDILLTTALNSQGREIIQDAIIRDLQFLLTDVPNTTLIVECTITSDDRLSVYINFNGKEFYLLWNPETRTLSDPRIPPSLDAYITEDGAYMYVTEDGLLIYGPE